MIPTVRIDLAHGHANIYKYRLRRTARLYAAELRRQTIYYDQPTQQPLSEVTEATTAPVAMIDWAKQDTEALNEITVLGQVESWSYGGVDRDALDSMPEPDYKALIETMEGLYTGNPTV